MFGVEAEKEINKSHFLITLLVGGLRTCQMISKLMSRRNSKAANLHFKQMNLPILAAKHNFITFIRFIYDGQVTEQFFCCKELPETTKGQDVFETLTSYLGSRNLSWERCVGICITCETKESKCRDYTLFSTSRSTNCKNNCS